MRFSKMQGVGNDFVVVNSDTPGYDDNPERLAVRVCDRQFGIGADGLLVVTRLGAPGPVPAGIADRQDLARHLADGADPAFAMRMFNPDGSEDMCGNGLRCVGLWALKHGWLESPSFTVLTKEGLRSVRIISVEDGCRSATLGVDMGRPHFEPDRIPFTGQPSGPIREFPLSVGGSVFPITSVNTGSTHTVIFGPQPSEEDFQYYSPLIEEHSLFPERTTVLWSTVVDACQANAPSHSVDGSQPADKPLRISTRIWERGAGETLGCGTGACAVAVAAQELCFARPGQVVQVKSKGGTLAIGWGGGDTAVDMVGPAVFVFEGELGRG